MIYTFGKPEKLDKFPGVCIDGSYLVYPYLIG